MKLCVIYNFAQHYRSQIFSLIDQEFDCDFLFGDSMGDVKKMDYSRLHGRVTETRTKRILGGWYWQPGVVRRVFCPYDNFIVLGETRALSTWCFCILARLLRPHKKVFIWTHGWYGKESRIESIVKKFQFSLPNGGIFTYGDYAKDLMVKQGFAPCKIHPIHNSLAYDEQLSLRNELKETGCFKSHFNNNNPNLVFVGRLTAVKKLDQILEALAICNKRSEYYNITFIGDGDDYQMLRRKSESLQLTEQVWFYGACYDERKLGELLYNADLCVAPGNIGLTAMHAMVFGTPCITHNDFPYQMPEFEAIVPDKTGLFFQRDDVQDLSRRITDWFNRNQYNRSEIRKMCMAVIDKSWNPYYQLAVIKSVVK